jgi:hypothetical protein
MVTVEDFLTDLEELSLTARAKFERECIGHPEATAVWEYKLRPLPGEIRKRINAIFDEWFPLRYNLSVYDTTQDVIWEVAITLACSEELTKKQFHLGVVSVLESEVFHYKLATGPNDKYRLEREY